MIVTSGLVLHLLSVGLYSKLIKLITIMEGLGQFKVNSQQQQQQHFY